MNLAAALKRKANPTDIVAILAVLAGLLLRLREASQHYLNPDEAQYFYLSVPSSLKQLYLATLQTHHPPLLFFVLHPVIAFSSSEFALRLIPVLAGSLVGWVVYGWLSKVWNPAAGLAALFILTFSPNLIALSAQARGYPLALLFAALALLALERSLEQRSIARMVEFAAWLYLAILSEYSAAWVAASYAIYFLLRVREARVSLRLFLVWAAVQSGALCIYATLYYTSMRHLIRESQDLTTSGFLQGAFPQAHSNLLAFSASATLKQFAYMLSSVPLGLLAAVLFGVGLILLWQGMLPATQSHCRTHGRTRSRTRSCSVVALLAIPFLLACAGALLKVHPYDRSRHTVILGLFIATGVAIGGERLLRSRPWLASFAALALISAWLTIAEPDRNNIPTARHSRHSMETGIAKLRAVIPPASVFLVERETAQVLQYYLDRQLSSSAPFRIATSKPYQWRDLEQFKGDVAGARRKFALRAEEPLWIVDGGWELTIVSLLRNQTPGLFLPAFHNFDDTLIVFQTPPGV